MTDQNIYFGGTFDGFHFGNYYSMIVVYIHARFILKDTLLHDATKESPLETNIKYHLYVAADKSKHYDGKTTQLSQEQRIDFIKYITKDKPIIDEFIELTGDYDVDLQRRVEHFSSYSTPFAMYFGPDQKDKEWAVKLRRDLRQKFGDRAHFYWITREFEGDIFHSSLNPFKTLCREDWFKFGEEMFKLLLDRVNINSKVVEVFD